MELDQKALEAACIKAVREAEEYGYKEIPNDGIIAEAILSYIAHIKQNSVMELDENALEDAAEAAFQKAQSVYRADHDHFPLKATWVTTTEQVREGWRGVAHAAIEAAIMPPLGTMPEPRQPRALTHAKQNEATGSAGDGRGPRTKKRGISYRAVVEAAEQADKKLGPLREAVRISDERALHSAPEAVVAHETAVGDSQASLSRTDEPQGGWQTVPKEPTADMKRAVLDIGGPQALAYGLAAWETMLAAAPSQKGQSDE